MARKDNVPPALAELGWLHDQRTGCFSAMVQMKTGDYLNLVKKAHEQRGGIAGQRDVLKTTTAKRIRESMISEIAAGAILPPVWLGVVIEENDSKALAAKHDSAALFGCIEDKELSIIDGMQRTASLLEAGT